MSSTVLELMRLNHEMIENAEKEIMDELDNYPSGVSNFGSIINLTFQIILILKLLNLIVVLFLAKSESNATA